MKKFRSPHDFAARHLSGRDHPKRLNIVRRARGLGFTLDKVRRLQAVLDDLVAECAGGTMPDCPIIETPYREAE